MQPAGLTSTLAAYLTTVSAASSYQPLSANLTALAANNAAYYLARGNHSGTQALNTISGLGTGIANALAVNAGAAGAPVLFNGAGGTPSSLGLLNATGLPLATGVSGLLSIANGGTGTATFRFSNPRVLENSTSQQGTITGMYLLDEEGQIVTRDVNARFVNGKPQGIEAVHIMQTKESWDRFMRFMERYSEDNGLTFTKSSTFDT